jgi:hypothetical protein
MLVLRAVGCNSLDPAVIQADRESKSNDIITRSDKFEPVVRHIGGLGGLVEEHLNVLQETGLCFTVKLLSRCTYGIWYDIGAAHSTDGGHPESTSVEGLKTSG